jgi:ferredoxin-like protein FixX
MSKMIKIIALFVALVATFSFSQEEINTQDSLEIKCPNESYVNSYGDTLCLYYENQEEDSSQNNLKIPSNRSTQTKKKQATNNNLYYNCPNGSYKNSKGNIVCSPSSSNTGGATAICRDGTYSYSQNRRGTCSKHGGVAKWL